VRGSSGVETERMTDVRMPLYIERVLYERIAAAAAASGQDTDTFARQALGRALLRWTLDHPGRNQLSDDETLAAVQQQVDAIRHTRS
jgi:hypothetical protein